MNHRPMTQHNLFTIAIIGRPNVGKSTFFNKLVNKNFAIVDDMPGVTRDRKLGIGNIGGYEFRVIDTPGLEQKNNSELSLKMTLQSEAAVLESDIVIFMIDGQAGILHEDQFFAKWLRKSKKPVILVINKAENEKKLNNSYEEGFRLGFGEPVCISAEHKIGFNFLIDAIRPHYEKKEALVDQSEEFQDTIQLSIIGKPNVGKSTLINALLNEDRTISSPIAGTTRDSIIIDWSYGDYKIRLVDTAGIRKKNKVLDKLEKLSVNDAKSAINFSHVVVVMIDATHFLEQQDLSIIDYALEEGRSVVIAANKWDLVNNKQEVKKDILYKIQRDLHTAGNIHIACISAINAENLSQLLDLVIQTYQNWNIRIPTSKLNLWIRDITSDHPIPLNAQKKRPKIKYITQIKTRPPTFMINSNYPDDINLSYQKYLMNRLRKDFNLIGTPIRLNIKKSNNPYHSSKE